MCHKDEGASRYFLRMCSRGHWPKQKKYICTPRRRTNHPHLRMVPCTSPLWGGMGLGSRPLSLTWVRGSPPVDWGGGPGWLAWQVVIWLRSSGTCRKLGKKTKSRKASENTMWGVVPGRRPCIYPPLSPLWATLLNCLTRCDFVNLGRGRAGIMASRKSLVRWG